MHPQIERYVGDILRRLPESDRQKAREDLISRIQSLLPSEPSDADVDRIIAALGSPWDIAEQYRTAHTSRHVSVNRILRGEVVFSMIAATIFGVLLIVAMLRFSQYIAWYDQGKPIIPVFHADVLKGMVPLVVSLTILSLLVSVGKIVYGYWSYPLAFFNAFYNACIAAFVLYFFYSGVFNEAFIERIGMLFSAPKDVALLYFGKGLLVLGVIVVIAIAWDIARCFYRAHLNCAARKI